MPGVNDVGLFRDKLVKVLETTDYELVLIEVEHAGPHHQAIGPGDERASRKVAGLGQYVPVNTAEPQRYQRDIVENEMIVYESDGPATAGEQLPPAVPDPT